MRDGAARVAQQVRELIELLVTRQLEADQLDQLADLLAGARRDLHGEPRPHWRRGEGDSRRPDPDRYLAVSLFQGREHPIAPPMQVTSWTDDTGRPGLRGRVRVGRVYEGPPRGVHGGYVAALFDELLGGVPARVGIGLAVTGTLKVRYRRITPVDVDLDLRAWLERAHGRRLTVRGTCHAAGQLTSEAEGLFIRLGSWDPGPAGPARVDEATSRPGPPTVRRGRPDDLDRVLALNNAAGSGVPPLDRASLEQLVSWAHRFWVVDDPDGGGVAAFLVLLGPGLAYERSEYRWFHQRFDHFLHVDRAVVAPDAQRHGLGALLYDAAVAAGRAGEVSSPVLLAQVRLVPRDDEALSFHQALGFDPIGEHDVPDGSTRWMMLVRRL